MKRVIREPPLNSLKVFSVVADYESISKAALDLHLTESAVSRQIKNLESSLELHLFTRRNRRLYLTNEGFVLQQCCKKIFTDLSDVIGKLSPKATDEPLIVSCEPTLTMRWLIPNLPKFQALNPDVTIHIYAAGGPINLRATKIDLALRRNDFSWENEYHSEKIADEIIGPVCSGDYWDENNHQKLKTQAPLKILHTQTRIDAWQRWTAQSPQSIKSESEMIFEHFYLSLQAAASGLGLAIGSLYMCNEELASKRLIAPFGFVKDGSAYHLLSETPIQEDQRKQAFFNWIQAEFKAVELAYL